MFHQSQLISFGAKWEAILEYSRAVRHGNLVAVSGTTDTDGNSIHGLGDAFVQAVYILKKIEKVL